MIEMMARIREKIFFTRYRDAARSMLLMTRRPSATTDGMEAKSEFISTRSEICAATSLPEAMATLQSASFKAKTSFTPSPVMATVCLFSWRAWTSSFFWLGFTRPKTLYSSQAF